MSEKETLKAMFARVGIGYTDESSADEDFMRYGDTGPSYDTRLWIWTDKGSTFGYGGFGTEFRFDADGALVGVGLWE